MNFYVRTTYSVHKNQLKVPHHAPYVVKAPSMLFKSSLITHVTLPSIQPIRVRLGTRYALPFHSTYLRSINFLSPCIKGRFIPFKWKSTESYVLLMNLRKLFRWLLQPVAFSCFITRKSLFKLELDHWSSVKSI